MPSRNLATFFDPRRNSLNAIRLALAAAVIVSHSWPLGGFGDDPAIQGVNLGTWAVSGFFAISGWLITGSGLGLSLRQYLWRRLLRIYPGYFVCLLAVAFLFAPAAAALGHADYSISSGVGYLLKNLGLEVQQWGVAHTLTDVPWPDTWNGPLWTLLYEFACYLVVAAIISISGNRRWVRFAVGSCFALAAAVQALIAWGGLSAPLAVDRATRLGVFFFAGALLYLLQDVVPASSRLALASLVLVVGAAFVEGTAVIAPIPFAYLCIWISARLHWHTGRKNDISYGIYIYGWPVQQMLAVAGAQRLGVTPFLLLSLVLTVPFAALSWKLVEQPALRLKGRSGDRRRPGSPDASPAVSPTHAVVLDPQQSAPTHRTG